MDTNIAEADLDTEQKHENLDEARPTTEEETVRLELGEHKDMRREVLCPLMKNLRQRTPAMADLLVAALGHDEMVDDQASGRDEQQVARVRVALKGACRSWA
jgi:hypothetical protein